MVHSSSSYIVVNTYTCSVVMLGDAVIVMAALGSFTVTELVSRGDEFIRRIGVTESQYANINNSDGCPVGTSDCYSFCKQLVRGWRGLLGSSEGHNVGLSDSLS